MEDETHEIVDEEKLASCLQYKTTEGWSGLMSKEGKRITPPLYYGIQAIDKNLYIAYLYEDYGMERVLIDEKGNLVK